MLEEAINASVPDGTHFWIEVLMPKGWLQYLIFEHQQVIAGNEAVLHAFSKQKRITGDAMNPCSGGMLLWEYQQTQLVTSGMCLTSNRFVYKIGNMRFEKPTKLYVYIVNSVGAADLVKIRLKYSEKELVEMI